MGTLDDAQLSANRPKAPMSGVLGSLASKVYGAVVARRNRAFDRGKGVVTFDRPVISVGNLSVGGTGKTPMVLHLVRLLRENGSWPCVAMRGYGRARGEGLTSDEAQVYQRAFPDLPMVAQPDRTEGLLNLFATEEGERVNCIILDDGFQHRRIARQLDIVLVDATRPPFGDKLLPAGWLREPISSLSRAHAAVVTHAEAVTRTDAIEIETRLWNFLPKGVVSVCRHAWTGVLVAGPAEDEERPTAWLRQQRVYLACAIGNPGPFLGAAREAIGQEPVGAMVLKDHAEFEPEVLSRLIEDLRRHSADVLLVTEKDWSKLLHVPLDRWPCAVARPRLELSFDRQGEALERAVLECVRLFKDEG
ncbi:MAG TPA: tetraacyldisaccharide 4'-kinase [Phycisphaerales bacterium]|nr:tetraacyldisaccharide 4'-kinase [Phycisphaerales bacterium]